MLERAPRFEHVCGWVNEACSKKHKRVLRVDKCYGGIQDGAVE